MIKLNVKANIADMRAIVVNGGREVNKAAARAINRAIDTARVTAGREVSAATKIKVREVRKRMTIRGANPSYLIAELEAHPYSPNLSAFNAKQNDAGVAATAWERRKTYQHAFILPSGKVVTRTSSARLPLKSLRGPSVPRTFMRPVILEKIEAAASARFTPEFEREITRRIG